MFDSFHIAAVPVLPAPHAHRQVALTSPYLCAALSLTSLTTGTTANLTTLLLPSCGISSTGAQPFANVLFSNTSLTKLDLSDNNLGNAGAVVLLESLECCKARMRSLSLRGNGIGEKFGIAFCFRVLSPPPYRRDEPDAGIDEPGLTYLNLSYNELGDEFGASLGDSLEAKGTLTCVDVTWNSIGLTGAVQLTRAWAPP